METRYIQLDVENQHKYGDINVNLEVLEVIASKTALSCAAIFFMCPYPL